jgi:hypothetical protein
MSSLIRRDSTASVSMDQVEQLLLLNTLGVL